MAPLELLYSAVAAARRRGYERHPESRHYLRQPVISVGNLSVGGTGKTPLVAQIAEWLIGQGERPAILSRGYKRSIAADGVTVVSDGKAVLTDVHHSGDEPMLLARKVRHAIVCVSEDRYLAGAVAARLGATVHLLDDGFQHVRLHRDFDILVTTPQEITCGRVLPHGRLREAPNAAARAHFAVVVGGERDEARTEMWELGISEFAVAQRHLKVDPGAAIAVAGIAYPETFFAMLRSAGVDVKATFAFADHHMFSDADVARIDASLRSTGATVVLTTEKDAVRFDAFGALPFAMTAVAMRLQLDDWSALTAGLQQVLVRARTAA
jgi:tetraacyldisaccharide 4'-kinase